MKKWNMLLSSLLLVLLLAACSSNVEDDVAAPYIERANEVVQQLNEGAYDDIYAQFNDTMKEQLTAEQLAQIEPILQQSGEFEGIDKQSVEEKDGIHLVVLIGSHRNENRIYTISYDANDSITGLFVQ
ncbi:DUF3887 domain-containing protein [Caryophanon latum]|uniref:DUF3887 domain-containing protein n=1 Tax=Caryophanon latum TaxID=33977 RepID=A0A1C0YB89_9BACL|nr:DUF3887 domain-containing protein [Caryophanon latum]OCS84457.1 hypothetical protein A6K76_15605 [Caryophanon latum]